MEHRWGNRRAADIRVHLRTPAGLAAKGRIRDISLSGAHIITHLPLTPHCRLTVSFPALPGLTRESGSPAIVEAEVVRRTADGFAVEWRDFGHETIREIAAALDPVAAHRQSRQAARARRP